MNIALISDIHDHTLHLLLALQRAREEGCERLFFMGDMARLETFSVLRREWTAPIDLVFGNNDFDRTSFLRMAEGFSQTTHHGDSAETEADGRHIAFTHYPAPAEKLANLGCFDAVFYGHTHVAHQERRGSTLLANPGEIQGRYSPGFAVYNTTANSVRFIEL